MLIIFRITYKNNRAFVIITSGYLSILCIHLSHLWSGKINYGYNMMLNITIGKFYIANYIINFIVNILRKIIIL